MNLLGVAEPGSFADWCNHIGPRLADVAIFGILGIALLLIGLAPVAWPFSASTDSLPFVVALNFVLWFIAVVHVLGAFGLVAFLIGHVYLTTTGHTPMTNIKAMITGWEDLPDDEYFDENP